MVYLDNCASTRPYDEVIEKIDYILKNEYANPSALHRFGFKGEQEIRKAIEIIAKSLNATEKEIIITSGATESNNMAIVGSIKAMKRIGNHIVTTSIEHPAVRKVCDNLVGEGLAEVTYLKVDNNGNIDLDDLKDSLKETTVLVSIMAVNNEVGTRLDIENAYKVVKEFNPNIIFHVDGVQQYLKYPVNIKYIDLYSVSAHKFHGPKGIGFLYKKSSLNIPPLIVGGSQQSGMRAGTLNTPLIVGMGEAVRLKMPKIKETTDKIKRIKEYFIEKLSKFDIASINANGDNISDYVCSVLFKGIRSEVMLHALEDYEIYVSAGSSCSAHSKTVSSVLTNIGLTKEDADSTIRFSFSEYTTYEDIDETIIALERIIPMLTRFVRR